MEQATAFCLLLIWFNILIRRVCGKPDVEEDPCETCVRLSECDGVDEDCPRRRK